MLVDEKLWKAVALGIEAENMKIELFIHHNHSLGTAREALLRSLVVQHSVSPYCVRSGFIHTGDPENYPHKQCDILVYDPRRGQPYYQTDEFVVVPPYAAAAIVEVKSDLGDDKEFNKLLGMQAYAQSVQRQYHLGNPEPFISHVPLLGFAYDGWTFNTFREKLESHKANLSALPAVIAVHKRNYLAVLETSSIPPKYHLIDFALSEKPGMATAFFFNIYHGIIAMFERGLPYEHALGANIENWFLDGLTIVPPEGKWLLRPAHGMHCLKDLPLR